MANEEIQVGFGLNTKAFATGLRQADNLARQYTSTIKSAMQSVGQSFAGIVSVQGLERLSEFGDQIKRTAETAGVSTDFVQNFGRVVLSVGGDVDSANMALDKLSGFIGQALQGETSEAASKFSDLGISLKDSEGNAKSTETVLRELAEKIKDAKTASEATALVMDVWGSKMGASMIPILREGSKGLDQFNDSTKLTNEEIETLVRSKAEFADMFQTIEIWAGKVVNMFANWAKLIGIIVEKIHEAKHLEWHPFGGGKGDSILGEAVKEYNQQDVDAMIANAHKPGGALAPPTKAPGHLVTHAGSGSGAKKYEDEEEAYFEELIKAYKMTVERKKKEAEKAKETVDLQDRYNELIRKQGQEQFAESQRGALYPTLQELANNRGPVSGIAQQIILAQRDQVAARANLNIDRAKGDQEYAQQGMDYLASAGVLDPADYEKHLADVAAQDTAGKIGELLQLAKSEGIVIKPPMGE